LKGANGSYEKILAAPLQFFFLERKNIVFKKELRVFVFKKELRVFVFKKETEWVCIQKREYE